MKMKMKIEFILREFIFAKIGISEDIYTNLAPQDIRDVFIKYGKEKYTYDEKCEKIILRDNFAVKIDPREITKEIKTSNLITLKFFRYYHRFYAIYVAISFILSFFFAVVYQFPPGSRKFGINVILFMIPLALLILINETIKGVKGIKEVDYSMEAEKVYSEILNAIKEKEKEKELDIIGATDNS